MLTHSTASSRDGPPTSDSWCWYILSEFFEMLSEFSEMSSESTGEKSLHDETTRYTTSAWGRRSSRAGTPTPAPRVSLKRACFAGSKAAGVLHMGVRHASSLSYDAVREDLFFCFGIFPHLVGEDLEKTQSGANHWSGGHVVHKLNKLE